MEWMVGKYKISTDKTLLSLEKITDLLSKSYWANNRPMHVIEKSIQNSDCYGVYFENEQVGFARVVTDHATIYWVCDVIIDEKHRGNELGEELIRHIVETDDFISCRGILATKDAHNLYKQFGFQNVDEELYMVKTISGL